MSPRSVSPGLSESVRGAAWHTVPERILRIAGAGSDRPPACVWRVPRGLRGHALACVAAGPTPVGAAPARRPDTG